MDKPQWGLRVDGPSGRRFLRGLSLTRLGREGCCGRLILLKAPFYNKTFTTGLRPLENYTTALRARKCIPPLVAGATTLPGGKHVTGFSVAYGSLRIQFLCHPRKRGHYGCLAMWPCLCRKAWKPILPPEQGEVRRSRIGGSRVAANHQNANQAI